MNEKPPVKPPQIGYRRGESYSAALERYSRRYREYEDYCVMWSCLYQAHRDGKPSHFLRAYHGILALELAKLFELYEKEEIDSGIKQGMQALRHYGEL